ncbi:MAG: glucose-6-phosphate isomerase [Planctomycetes bacterium]|nr:glucose-6-phosphate isomerase [Planctomycetota bacterium]
MGHDFERFRAFFWHDPDLGMSLDPSHMGLEDAALDALAEPFAAAFTAMDALEGGAIANPDEGRMVGHYWLRDAARAPDPALRAAIETTREAVREFAARVLAGDVRTDAGERFSHVVSIGIGGSALGPQFVSRALAEPRPPLSLYFLDNTDPDGFDRLIEQLGGDLARTLVLSISKSGTTAETRNGTIEIRRAMEARSLDFPSRAVAVTGDGSSLHTQARDEGWLATFPMWDWIGGRTSETCAVGLLPAALEGIDVDGLLAGAAAMDALTRRHDVRNNPAALLAACWHHATDGVGKRDMVILPYKDRLDLLSRYLQQLIMESLGKETDQNGRTVHQGISVYGNKGSTDQHAFVQQLREGVSNFFVTFVEVLRDRGGECSEIEPGVTSGDHLAGFLMGTRHALTENGRPSLTVTLPDVSPRSLGALIALYERAVGLYASLIGINAYHQPGVEAGKRAAGDVLDLQSRLLEAIQDADEPLGLVELARRAGTDDLESAFLIMRRLAVNRDDVATRGDPARPLDVAWFRQP